MLPSHPARVSSTRNVPEIAIVMEAVRLETVGGGGASYPREAHDNMTSRPEGDTVLGLHQSKRAGAMDTL